MANYEICYVDKRRALTSYIATDCIGDIQAMSFAQSMAPPGPVRVEVWRSGDLVWSAIRSDAWRRQAHRAGLGVGPAAIIGAWPVRTSGPDAGRPIRRKRHGLDFRN